MKHQIICLLVFILLSTMAFGQSQASFNNLVFETKAHLKQYSKLSPFEEYYTIKDFGFSKKVIQELLMDATLKKKKDSIASYHIIGYFQDKILTNIQKLISHSKFKENNIIELLLTNNSDLSIFVSDDNKLYNFSLDEKTGGTYRSRISIMHYTDIEQDNLPTQEEIDKGIKLNPYGVFEGDGFNGIYAINTKEGVKYVLTGYVRGCSYCFENNIMLVKFKNGFFHQEFIYSVNSRSWEESICYDSTTQTIDIHYVTDDLITDCYCINNTDQYDGYFDMSKKDPIVKKCHCTFEFNGLNFELTKENQEILK